MLHLLDTVPWFLPGSAVAAAIGIAACGPVARALGTRPLVAWLLLAGLGLVIAATLTPQREALDHGAIGSGRCDLSRLWPASLAFYAGDNDAFENVLLFVPIGAVIALLPRSRPAAVLVAGAVMLPLAIEFVQTQALVLNRSCESADVVDNLAGLAVGFGVGSLLAGTIRLTGRRSGGRARVPGCRGSASYVRLWRWGRAGAACARAGGGR